MKLLEVFCDGSCLGNPGPGGWGSIIKAGAKETRLSGGKKNSTNNEMELTAAIEALKIVPESSKITLTTDSQYLTKGMTEWMVNWIKNGWKTASKKPVKNRQLWEELNSLSQSRDITWVWVRGHSGHPENEECDKMAFQEASRQK